MGIRRTRVRSSGHCLRQRVRSYFGEAASRFRKLRRLRSRVRAVEWIETGSELEALLLESRLVKERHPPFNALLHRHRHLVFLRLDLADAFPRIRTRGWKQLRRSATFSSTGTSLHRLAWQ